MRPKIALISTTDFISFPLGGGLPTINIFLKYAREREFDIWLFGLTTTKKEPIGHVSYRVIYGIKYPFIPLVYVNPEQCLGKRPLIPIRMQTFMSYIIHRSAIDRYSFDLLYLHAPEGLPLFFNKKQRILFHIHGLEETAATYSRYGIFRSSLFMWVYKKAIRYTLERSDELIVIDDESYDVYTKMMPNEKDKFHLLPTAIDTDLFRPLPNKHILKNEYRLPSDKNIILYVGRLSYKKGVDLILDAFYALHSQRPSTILVVAGEGEDETLFHERVGRLGIGSSVIFLGQISHDELPKLYNCADVAVIGSFHESLALVILEALACGVPVVSTPVGIAPKVIRDGQSGFLVRSRNPEEMSDKLQLALVLEQREKQECVDVAAEYAATSKRICDVIEEMLNRQ